MCSLITHDTPQLNGVAEQLNQSLLERIQALQHTSAFPKSMWGDALRHATWLKNCTATRMLGNKTPYEELFGTPPDLSGLRLWGCNAWVHDDSGTKLDAHAREGHWLGFNVDARAHRIYWPSMGTMSMERNVYFATASLLEGEELRLPVDNSEQIAVPDAPSTSIPSPIPIDPLSSPITSSPPPIRRSTHVRQPLCPIRELQAGEGVTYSDTNAPHPAPNLQAPVALADDSEESGGVWTVEEGTPMLLEDFDGMEFIFAIETADAEALEPRMSQRRSTDLTGPLGRRPLKRSWPHSRLLAPGDWRTHPPEPMSSAQSGYSRQKRMQPATSFTTRLASSPKVSARLAVLTMTTRMHRWPNSHPCTPSS